jgi:N-methylhydantoinase A
MVVCGWLGHSDMAYGQLHMNTDLAKKAVGSLAEKLGRSVEETAQAILDVAVSEMFVEVEKLASRVGVDLREFTLMPFGGGGPMLGAFLARELGMKKVIAPRRPGVVSALGGLVADLRGDFIRTVYKELTDETLAFLDSQFSALAAEGQEWLQAQGYSGEPDLRFSADMRYAGQAISDAFHLAHQKIYDFDDRDGRVEIVNVRLSAVGTGPKPEFPQAPASQSAAVPARHARVFISGWKEVPLFERKDLGGGCCFDGPAIVAQEDTTFSIPEGTTAQTDQYLNIHLSFAE